MPENINLSEAWKIACENIRLYLSKRDYDSWFSNTILEKIDNGIAEISCDQAFKREWLEMYHRAIIRRALLSATGQNLEPVFSIRAMTKKREEGNAEISSIFVMPEKNESLDQKGRKAQLNPRYLLSNFVVGAHNKLAFAVAEAVVQNPGHAYNPVFYYGPTGVGKTHLMQAIGNEMLKADSSKKVLYAPIEQFLNEFLESIKSRTNEQFRKKYRENDLLILDDIQFLETYPKTQEELFNTFNALYQANKQIILASDRLPREIKNLTDRLRSRFEGGMVADIQAPDMETRMAIIKYLGEESGVIIEPEVLELVAKNIESNIRELEGAVTKIVSITKMGETPNPSVIAKMLQIDLESKRKRLKPERVIDAVCEVFGVTQKEIKSKNRTAYLALARQVIMFLLREELQLPLERVAKEVNRKDHTTVIHACEKIGELVKAEGNIKEKVFACKELLA